jgi:signal transduction histidine kinase
MHDDALAMARSLSGFMDAVAHELRTELSAIIGYAEVLVEDTALDADTRLAFSREVLAAGRDMLRLLNDGLDIGRVGPGNDGHRALQPEEIEVDAVVRGVAAVARALTKRRQQVLEVKVEGGAGSVRHDAVRLKQALFGLLSHAAAVAPENGTIGVAARRDAESWLEVDITYGARAEEQEGLRDARRAEETMAPPGVPPGLAEARRHSREMGGGVSLRADGGGGVTLTLRLPPSSSADEPAAGG